MNINNKIGELLELNLSKIIEQKNKLKKLKTTLMCGWISLLIFHSISS
jgi:hypothetical protein